MSLFSRKRPITALQIEVTSRCTRRCLVCPRTALESRWRDGDLSADCWLQIEPTLRQVEHVHLQGWGEPLLHAALPHMIRSAKRAGARVGLTSNGDLVEASQGWLLEAGVDQVTLSLGGGSSSHPRHRGGSSFERVVASAQALAARARSTRRRIQVQISYLLTRDNAPDLPAVVIQAARAGVTELFVTHLDVTPTPDLWDRRAFDRDGLAPGVAKHLDAAETAARRHHLRFRGPARSAEDLLACALNPTRFAFVAWDGRVGPCVNLMLPVTGPIPRWSASGGCEVAPVCYGRLDEQPLADILTGHRRATFVAPFERRLRAEQRFRLALVGLGGAETMRRLEPLDVERDEALQAAPFPVACQACNKREGW